MAWSEVAVFGLRAMLLIFSIGNDVADFLWCADDAVDVELYTRLRRSESNLTLPLDHGAARPPKSLSALLADQLGGAERDA